MPSFGFAVVDLHVALNNTSRSVLPWKRSNDLLLPTVHMFLSLPVTCAVFLFDFNHISAFCTSFLIIPPLSKFREIRRDTGGPLAGHTWSIE